MRQAIFIENHGKDNSYDPNCDQNTLQAAPQL